MSEDEQIPFNNRTHDRLTELEKKLNTMTKFESHFRDSSDHHKNVHIPLTERIEKLERDNDRLEGHRVLGNKTMTMYLNKKAKELSELKEEVRVLGNVEDGQWSEMYNIKEVLREFQMIAESSIDFKTFSALSKTLRAKLGGDSEEWTEEKCENSYVGHVFSNFGEHRCVRCHAIKPDSKPPSKCWKCGSKTRYQNGVYYCTVCEAYIQDSKPPRDSERLREIRENWKENPSEQTMVSPIIRGVFPELYNEDGTAKEVVQQTELKEPFDLGKFNDLAFKLAMPPKEVAEPASSASHTEFYQVCQSCPGHDECVADFKDICSYCPNRLDLIVVEKANFIKLCNIPSDKFKKEMRKKYGIDTD